ncbi:MAG: beta-hydroxyacyl-ACP dehydratase [Deltaproteobacteria bacterium]|nr:beta-hydroxyacyl-ACP dehydratase [Deltaproteobacteria bacterium]
MVLSPIAMRWFLVDRVTEFVPGERARGVKGVTLTEGVLHDHFPEHPLFPGVLIIEALAQLAGFLLEVSTNRRDAPLRRAVLVSIDRARFHAPVWAGDLLDLRVAAAQVMDAAARVDAEAWVGTERAAQASLTFMLRAIDSEAVHAQRRALYQVWTRTLDPRPELL